MNDWAEEAAVMAEHCTTKEDVARCIASWMQTAAQHARNEEFWRDLLYQCASNLGPFKREAFIQDDGGIVDEPLGLKIPDLVGKLRVWGELNLAASICNKSIGEFEEGKDV